MIQHLWKRFLCFVLSHRYTNYWDENGNLIEVNCIDCGKVKV